MRAALALLLAVLCGGALRAEDTPRLAVELNDVSAGPGPCKAVFVLNNGLGTAIAKLTLRLVAFDKGGRALRFVALEAGAMPNRKTRVLRFDLTEQPCGDLGRVVLDDVTACEGGDLSPAACLAALDVSSRAGLDLAY